MLSDIFAVKFQNMNFTCLVVCGLFCAIFVPIRGKALNIYQELSAG